jgi:hypothetical protein
MIFQVLDFWCFLGLWCSLLILSIGSWTHKSFFGVEIIYSFFCFQLQVVSLHYTTICGEVNHRYHEYYFEII